MPRIISTPEEWFRTNKRDLHLIRFIRAHRRTKIKPRQFKKLHSQLRSWLATKLPEVPVKVIGPSEYSGWLFGGPGYLVADFGVSDIELFYSVWRHKEFWKIESWSYSEWRKRVESAALLQMPITTTPSLVRWWDTPQGIILLDAATTGAFIDVAPGTRVLSRRDSWWRLQQLVPEYESMDINTFPNGYYLKSQDKKFGSLLVVESFVLDGTWNSCEYSEDARKMQKIKIESVKCCK